MVESNKKRRLYLISFYMWIKYYVILEVYYFKIDNCEIKNSKKIIGK